jgi:ABC-type histidine transport system ATPase subunit
VSLFAAAYRHRDDRREQVVWRVPCAARHQPEGRARREARDLRPVGLRQVDDDPLHQPAGEHQKGKIIVDGTELTNDLKKIDEVRRDVGMVFQHFNLFPHLTILENCTLAPIWVRKMPKKDAEEIGMHYLKRVKIPEQALKYPASSRAASSSASRSPARSA